MTLSLAPGPANTALSASSRASSHSSNTFAWSSVAGKSVRTKPASGLRVKNHRRICASKLASSAAAETARREISGLFRLEGETCSRFKERARFIRFSGRKSGKPRITIFALAAGPRLAKGSEMPAITTRVKNLFHEGFISPNRGAKDEQTEHGKG